MMKILITGANGFVGKSTSTELLLQGKTVRSAVRAKAALNNNVETTIVGEINGVTDWSQSLVGIKTVVHLAARVHVMQDKSADPLAEFRAVNVDGTLNLARQAAAVGIKRFIFLSTIKVNGELTLPNQPFTPDTANPLDAYGISKHEAEIGLRKIASETGMQVVIIRPPLVYGAGVKANFASLLSMVKRGLPLPFGLVTNNRRSFLALDNLVDLIITCINHPNAANQTFLASDNEDVSTTVLLRKMALAEGIPSRLLPVPVAFLNVCAKLIGKQDMAQRLLGNLQVDISHTQKVLDWQPTLSLDEGLRRAFNNA